MTVIGNQPDYIPETIAAIATPAGRGGVGIVRVSGEKAQDIAKAILGKIPQTRKAEYLPFLDENKATIDTGLALYFPNPHSFTGEDVLELHGHGGPIILDLILQRVLSLGVRPARPGEFSERAFLNDKIDLTQAEAIADLIESSTVQAARSATQSLNGVFSDWVHETIDRLTELRIFVEAAIDFPEEEIDFLADKKIAKNVESLIVDIDKTIKQAHQGQLLREGMRVVLAGKPNTGKSSLLNCLAGRESAIVTDIPGTTRDVLKEEINIDGMPVHIIDTAGLRDTENCEIDPVEKEGMRRTWKELEQANIVLLLLDDSQGFGEEEKQILDQLPKHIPVTLLHNKIDLSQHKSEIQEENDTTHLWLSIKKNNGLDLLRDHLKSCVGYTGMGEGQFMARRRHLVALNIARDHVENGLLQLKEHHAGELLAEELRQAQRELGEITGEVSSDDLLGKIFSSFCIGK